MRNPLILILIGLTLFTIALFDAVKNNIQTMNDLTLLSKICCGGMMVILVYMLFAYMIIPAIRSFKK